MFPLVCSSCRVGRSRVMGCRNLDIRSGSFGILIFPAFVSLPAFVSSLQARLRMLPRASAVHRRLTDVLLSVSSSYSRREFRP